MATPMAVQPQHRKGAWVFFLLLLGLYVAGCGLTLAIGIRANQHPPVSVRYEGLDSGHSAYNISSRMICLVNDAGFSPRSISNLMITSIPQDVPRLPDDDEQEGFTQQLATPPPGSEDKGGPYFAPGQTSYICYGQGDYTCNMFYDFYDFGDGDDNSSSVPCFNISGIWSAEAGYFGDHVYTTLWFSAPYFYGTSKGQKSVVPLSGVQGASYYPGVDATGTFTRSLHNSDYAPYNWTTVAKLSRSVTIHLGGDIQVTPSYQLSLVRWMRFSV